MVKEASEQDDDMAILDQVTLEHHAKGKQAELHHTGGGIYYIRLLPIHPFITPNR